MAHVQGRALRLRLRAGWCSSPRGRQAGPRGRDVTAPRAARCRPGGQRSVLDPGLSIQSGRDVSPLCSTSASARSGPAAPPRARGLRLGPCTASRGHGAGDLALDDPLWGSSWRQCRPARTGHAASPATPGAAPRGHSPGDAAQLAHMLAVRSEEETMLSTHTFGAPRGLPGPALGPTPPRRLRRRAPGALRAPGWGVQRRFKESAPGRQQFLFMQKSGAVSLQEEYSKIIIVCGLEGALFPPTAFPLVSDILEARHRQMRSPSAAAAENAGVIARGLRKK
ncbi:unnamed protein product, partial [Prorocentrum cordatum]